MTGNASNPPSTAQSATEPDGYQVGDRTVAEAIAFGLAETLGVSPVDLEPLHEAVDPDALDALLARDDAPPDAGVSFVTNGCTVVVTGHGRIRIRLRDPDSGSERREAGGAGSGAGQERERV